MVETYALDSFGMVLEIETDPNKVYPEQAGSWSVPDLSQADSLPVDLLKPVSGTWTQLTGATYIGTKVYQTVTEANKFDELGDWIGSIDFAKAGLFDIPSRAFIIRIVERENNRSIG